MNDLASHWEAEGREFALACDRAGVVRALDPRAERRLGVAIGTSFFDLVAPGAVETARQLFERGARERVLDTEVPILVVDAGLTACSLCVKPDGAGGVLVLGSLLPEAYGRALVQAQASRSEIVDLDREIARQKLALERQEEDLERTTLELDESNRGVVSLHAELEDKAALLKRAADVKGRVVANVSHEFRTPLHTILGLSKLLMDRSDGPLGEEQEKQVRFIRASAEELQALVNDLLDLSRAESGKTQLRPEKFSIDALFAAMRGQMRPLLPNQDVTLSFEPPSAPVELETDHGKVAQILRNLISNAMKFTERGEVRVAAEASDGDVVFRVSDTGLGIAPENFDRIFEEFGQIDSDIQKRVKGTGLGLPLSRRLAERLDGTLTVDSELGSGSVFTLTIPRVHPEVRELASIVERPVDSSKAPVLVVEDDRKTIFVYEKYLSMTGFQVLAARTVADARALMKAHRPSAIVLDVMLEGETSWEFLAELKRDPATADIPVLVVTVTSKAQKARALGADEFWLKPIDQGRLIKKLKTLTRSGARTKLLVIDDDEKARYLIKRLLSDSPYQMTEAADGPEGVRLAQELRPNVIFLDFLLKDMTAFDVLDELKSDPRTRGIPVIVVTSHDLDAADRSRLSAETEAIVPKEQLSRELAINRIRDALRKAGVGPKL